MPALAADISTIIRFRLIKESVQGVEVEKKATGIEALNTTLRVKKNPNYISLMISFIYKNRIFIHNTFIL